MALSLGSSGARSAVDVPAAVRTAAANAGHRPAITLLAPAPATRASTEGGPVAAPGPDAAHRRPATRASTEGGPVAAPGPDAAHRRPATRASNRQEQSFTSLAQWTAKTAHWLTLDLLLEPGDRLGIVGPPGWVPAAAALGAWWAGLTVVVGDRAADADVVLSHVDGAPSAAGDLVVWGWGFDGAPEGDGPADAFVEVVQPFPDDPPAPLGTAPSPALDDGDEVATQGAMLDALRDEPAEVVGVEAGAGSWLAIAALRPLLTARTTVLLGPGVDRSAASGDRVARWLP